MYLLFDIGGTKTRIAVSPDGIKISDHKIISTPSVFEEGVAAIISAGKELAGDTHIEAAGGGIAGSLDKEKSGLARGGHLRGWKGKSLVAALSEPLGGIPVFIDNDAAIVGLGEAHDGAGKGFDIVVYITVSTGVGGVRIVEGKIDANRFGFEPGHQIINASGEVKQLEKLVSGRWIEQKYGKAPREITDQSIWDEVGDLFSAGLTNSILHWSPDVVVLGGSMMNQPGLPLDRIKANIADNLSDFPFVPEIKKSELGDIGGLHGALVHVSDNYFTE